MLMVVSLVDLQFLWTSSFADMYLHTDLKDFSDFSLQTRRPVMTVDKVFYYSAGNPFPV